MTNGCHATDGYMLPITNGCIKTVRCNHFCNRKPVCIRGLHCEDNRGLYCIRGLHGEDNRGLYCIRRLQFEDNRGLLCIRGLQFEDNRGLYCIHGLHCENNRGLYCIRRLQFSTARGLYCICGLHCEDNRGLLCIRRLQFENNRGLYCIHGLHVRHMKHMKHMKQIKFGSMRLSRNQVTLRSLILDSLCASRLEKTGLRGLPWAAAQTRLGTSPQTPSPLRGGLKPQNKKDPPQLSRSDSVVKGPGNSVPLRGLGRSPNRLPRLNLPLSRLPDGSAPFARTSADRQEFGCRPSSRCQSDSGQTRSLHRWKSLRR